MKTLRLVGMLLLVVALTLTATGSAYGAPQLQRESQRQGLFGDVSSVVDNTIILDSGEIVATDENTLFVVPGVDDADLNDIAVGDRLAIVAIELADGSLLAVNVLVTPEKPVSNTHVLVVVTGAQGGLITLIDNRGRPHNMELPVGKSVKVGDLLTLVIDPDDDTDTLKPRDIAAIDKVVDKLLEDIQDAVGRARERLQELLEDNGNEHLTALARALEQASDEAQQALQAALISTQSRLAAQHQGAGVEGPFIKIKGFVTAFDVTDGSGTITIDSLDDGEVTIDVTPATRIEDPIVVGDFVEVKYNLDLEAAKIELESDKLEFEGTIARFSAAELVLEDGTTFVMDGETEIEGALAVGAEVEVEARPMGGSLVALEVEVEEEDEEVKVGEFKLKGTITAFSETEIEVDGFGPIMRTPATTIVGTLALNAKVEVKAILKDGSVVALEIKVKEDKPEEFELRGILTAFSETELEVDGFGPVLITPGTEMKGTPGLGLKVRVEAILQDGSVVALKVEVKEDEDKEVEFRGIVTALSATELEVDGFGPILITPETDVEGTLSVGVEVDVEIKMTDGDLIATEIDVEDGDERRHEGIVASFSATELVLEDGTTFVVNAGTDIDGTLTVGAEVEVEAIAAGGVRLIAREIKVK